MKKLIAKIRAILRNRWVRKIWMRTVSSIACLVVFVTTYALVLPAITMESEASCGIEAHQHDESCYEERLTCDLPESDGHVHTDDCYATVRKLTCGRPEHLHTADCRDDEGNLTCGKEEHQHDADCYKEVRELVCGLEESEGHHHDSSCYEKVLTCGKEAHTHSQACYRGDGAGAGATGQTDTSAAATEHAAMTDQASATDQASMADQASAVDQADASSDSAGQTDASAAAADQNASAAETADAATSPDANTANNHAGTDELSGADGTFDPAETASEGYVPALEELDFQQLLNNDTAIYYHRPAADEEADTSGQTADWQKVEEDTVLGEDDLLRVYLAYTIPAGSLNETNTVARYRLPENLRLTDEQVEEINQTENSLSGMYVDYDTLEITDTEKHSSYLGYEAVEGERTPDQAIPSEKSGKDDSQVAQDIISATVKAEKVHDKDGAYGKKNAYLGTDLVFTFSPDTIQKNRNEYDSEGTPVKAGENVSGWFALDLNMDQVDWDGSAAEVIFVSEDKGLGTSLISAALQKAELNAGETLEETHPAVSFEDTIKVRTGSLGSDTATGSLPDTSKLTVSVSAEAGTFPAGTTMVLSTVSDMESVAEAVESTVDRKTCGFQAVDISFRDTDGNEIEPLKPINVTMRSESIKAATEDTSMAPVVVHVEDQNSNSSRSEDFVATVVETLPNPTENNEKSDSTDNADPSESIFFEAGSFSVYAIVYTVDFEYFINGKLYHFSLPGGGFVSFTDLVEVLGIVGDTNDEVHSEEAGTESVDNEAESTINNVAEENRINDSLTLEDVELSDAAKNFVVDVEKIEFSTPGLLFVSKTEKDTTVGEIKDGLGLACEYSSNLNEEQISRINEQKVNAGDWALISLHPFTSEETLTVTMKTGEVFTIKVTDSQDPYGLDGQSFEMIVNGNKALSPISETEPIGGVNYQFLNNADPQSGSNLAWQFEYDHEAFGEDSGGYYISHAGQYLKIVGDNNSDPNRTVTLVNSKAEATPVAVKYDKSKGKYSFSNKADSSSGFLRQFNDDYFGVDGNSNDDNAWFELRDPVHPGKPALVSPWDVKGDNIRIKLFDYTGTVSGGDIDDSYGDKYSASTWHSGTGINNGRTLIFSGGGLDSKSDGKWNYYTGQQPAVMQGIVKNGLSGGYPELTNTTGNKGASLGYLFGAGGQDGVITYAGSDGTGLKGLLRRDEKGYYYYSSEQNFATLVDPETGQIVNDEIHIYSESYKKDKPSVNAQKIGFFPFDPYRAGETKAGEEKGFNGSPYNHQFGMTLEADFALPPNGKLPNGEEMTFSFSGDDDVWVFIDDVLVLDLGGVHQPLSGKINFAEGKSYVTDASIQTVPGQTNTVGNGRTIKELFEAAGKKYDDSPYSPHTIKFFYLERGGCDSNCTLSFNLDVIKGKGSVNVAKYDKDSQPVTPLKGVKFGLYSDPECTDLMKEVTSEENGIVPFKDLLIRTDDQKYYLKELKELAGYQKDETIYTLEAVKQEAGKYYFKVLKDGREIETIGQNPVIYNEHLKPITLNVEKQWQSTDGNTISPPVDASATFKVQRYFRKEGDVVTPGEYCTLNVYRIKDSNTASEGSYKLAGGTTAHIKWGYRNGYYGGNTSVYWQYKTNKNGGYSSIQANGTLDIDLPRNGSTNLYIRDENVGNEWQWGSGVIDINVNGTTEPVDDVDHISTEWGEDNEYNNAGNCPTLSLPENDSTPWTGKFANLKTVELKDDGMAYYYRYYIVETGKTPENAQTVYVDGDGHVVQNASSLQTDEGGKTQTIINKVETTHFSANKTWVNQDGTPAILPHGTSISFHLYADGKDTGKNIVLNGKTDVAEVTDEETQELNTSAIENGAYESKPWGAYWGDLPKYTKNKDGDWVEIKYTVSEKINDETGFLPEVNEVTKDGGTIKNVRKGAPPDPEIPDPDNTNPEIHKRIDALRDAVGNPDTTLDDDSTQDLTDLYRLYLDYKINSVQEPEGVDMLFILDHSGSMNSYAFGGNPYRAPIVEAVLNGDNGLIAQFLAMNENNRWAAVGFKGDPGGWYVIGYNAQNAGKNDSEILSPGSGWQTQRADIHLPLERGWPIYVPGEGLLNEGETRLTDYTAGLWRAEQFLENNDNRKKVLVFISDGIPTLYIPCDGSLKDAGTMTGSDYYPDNNGTGGCTQETREQFANFVSDMTEYGYTFGENAEFYTVGFGNSILSATSGKALLKGMLSDAYGRDVSSTNFIGIGDGSVRETVNAMRDALGTLIGTRETFSSLVIQDDLSQYVDLYGIAAAGNDSAAILNAASTKVTMTDPANTSNVIVLYQNGSVTGAGLNILKGVSYDPATKTVKAEFKEGYKAEPGIRYTLSFDVKATEKAYSDFARSGYYSTGDEDTDFKGTNPPNDTSSGKLGFHSNDSAKATYKHNDKPEEKPYKHPVVQVFPKIRIVKEDQTGSLLEGAKFELYEEGYDPAKTSQENAEFKLKEMISQKEKNDSVDALIYEDVLKPGTYYLIETEAPDGFTLLEAPIQIKVKEDQETSAITVEASIAGTEIAYPKLSKDYQSGDWKLIVVNNAGAELPSTGGPGTHFLYVLGCMLIVFAGISMLLQRGKASAEGLDDFFNN